MPEHHLQTGEMYEAEEVLDVVFPSGDEAAEIVHPGKQPLSGKGLARYLRQARSVSSPSP